MTKEAIAVEIDNIADRLIPTPNRNAADLHALAAAVRSLPAASDLIAAVKDMAEKCHLQNSEQISEVRGAIGAVLMIRLEYLDLLKKYCARADSEKELVALRAALEVTKQAIEKAPHGAGCACNYPVCQQCGRQATQDSRGGWDCLIGACGSVPVCTPPCNCWKSAALARIEEMEKR